MGRRQYGNLRSLLNLCERARCGELGHTVNYTAADGALGPYERDQATTWDRTVEVEVAEAKDRESV